MSRSLAILVLVAIPVSGLAQAKPGEPIAIQAAPAAAPARSLQYRLLPAPHERVAGNAATLYYRTFSFLGEQSPAFFKAFRFEPVKDDKGREYFLVPKWLEMPLKELPRDKVRVHVDLFRHFLRELELAAHRQSCDWDVQGRREGMLLLLPEVQSFRRLGSIVLLKARLQMAEGQYEQALRTLRTNMALGRHLGRGPTQIHVLVGAAIATQTLQGVEELLRCAGAPNLYWALTALPAPFCDLQSALEEERDLLPRMFPRLKELEKGPVSLKVIAGLREDVRAWKKELHARGPSLQDELVEGSYPEAKKNLIREGFPAESVDKMPRLQVVVVDALRRHRAAQEELFKWIHLSYHQASPHLEEATAAFKKACARIDLVLCDGILSKLDFADGYAKTWSATTRLDRRLAALRVVEALRLHAAANGGKLPAALDKVQVVPVPLDPVTGKPFVYKMEGNKATIHGPAPAGSHDRLASLSYVLTLVSR
jgi:hypothetical protein